MRKRGDAIPERALTPFVQHIDRVPVQGHGLACGCSRGRYKSMPSAGKATCGKLPETVERCRVPGLCPDGNKGSYKEVASSPEEAAAWFILYSLDR